MNRLIRNKHAADPGIKKIQRRNWIFVAQGSIGGIINKTKRERPVFWPAVDSWTKQAWKHGFRSTRIFILKNVRTSNVFVVNQSTKLTFTHYYYLFVINAFIKRYNIDIWCPESAVIYVFFHLYDFLDNALFFILLWEYNNNIYLEHIKQGF